MSRIWQVLFLTSLWQFITSLWQFDKFMVMDVLLGFQDIWRILKCKIAERILTRILLLSSRRQKKTVPWSTKSRWTEVKLTIIGCTGVQWRSQEVEVGGQNRKFPSPPPVTARGSGERCKLPQWGLGQSPSRQRFWCILDQKKSFWCDLNLPQWCSQEIEIGGKFIFLSCPSSPTVFRTWWASLVGSGAEPQLPTILVYF